MSEETYSSIPTAHDHQVPRESIRSRRLGQRALGVVSASRLGVRGSRKSVEQGLNPSHTLFATSPARLGNKGEPDTVPGSFSHFRSAPKSRSLSWQVIKSHPEAHHSDCSSDHTDHFPRTLGNMYASSWRCRALFLLMMLSHKVDPPSRPNTQQTLKKSPQTLKNHRSWTTEGNKCQTPSSREV